MKWKQLGTHYDFNVFKGKSAGHAGTEQSGGRQQVLGDPGFGFEKGFM